jgi:hypothetical protein
MKAATVKALEDATTDKKKKLCYKSTGECSFLCIFLASGDGEVVL